MARLYPGSINYPLNFNVGKVAPLDSRAVVEHESDLIASGTWTDKAPAYKGMAVIVTDTFEIWVLMDTAKVSTNDYSGWKNLTRSLIKDTSTAQDNDTTHTYSVKKILELIGSIATFNIVKKDSIESLPASGDTHTIYLVPNGNESGTNICNEYLYIDNNYELIGNTLITVGTLNTDNSTAQTVNSSESLSGNISLHKVAKTGDYTDLLNKPNIPTDTTYTFTEGETDGAFSVTPSGGTASSVNVHNVLKTTGGTLTGQVYYNETNRTLPGTTVICSRRYNWIQITDSNTAQLVLSIEKPTSLSGPCEVIWVIKNSKSSGDLEVVFPTSTDDFTVHNMIGETSFTIAKYKIVELVFTFWSTVDVSFNGGAEE